ncbi:Rod shape-determining protein [gamma proteobacterium HdN1]|nr:Rod shape-determining protein [gamma proteobacterium HdN1]
MNRSDYLRQLPPNELAARRNSFLQTIHIDGFLLMMLLILMGGGLIVLYSASSASIDTVIRQALRMGLGLLVMCVAAQIPATTYRRWSLPLYGFGVLLLIATLIFGSHAKGAQRWLDIPGLGRFQPSEIMKLLVPLSVAAIFATRSLPPRWSSLLMSTGIILVPTLLIAKQPDLGTALLIASSGFITMFLAGLDWRILVTLAGSSVPAGWLLWELLHDYQRQRILTFLNPESDPWGTGWNIMQSKTAIGSGGFDGKGWLNGTQSHLDFLPESSTDFIIAALAEEFGFTGVCLLLLVYLIILIRGGYIALQAGNNGDRLIAGTLTLTFFVYIFVNIGMVSGILPVVGVPLPMVSYGGTSVVTLLASFGILMSIHTHRQLLN